MSNAPGLWLLTVLVLASVAVTLLDLWLKARSDLRHIHCVIRALARDDKAGDAKSVHCRIVYLEWYTGKGVRNREVPDTDAGIGIEEVET